MTTYDLDAPSSSAQPPKPKRRWRAPSEKCWAAISGNVKNQHERLRAIDPSSPRIKPSVGIVGFIIP